MRFEILLAKPQHFLEPRLIRLDRRIVSGALELRPQRGGERRAVALVEQPRRQPVVAEAAIALFRDEAGVLQETEVSGHAGLREAEDAGQLRDVQALGREDAQQAQARFVAQQAVERGRLFHIY